MSNRKKRGGPYPTKWEISGVGNKGPVTVVNHLDGNIEIGTGGMIAYEQVCDVITALEEVLNWGNPPKEKTENDE